MDGLDILRETESRDQKGKIASALKHANISTSLRKSVNLEDIARIHFLKEEGTKAQKAAAQRFWKLIEEASEFDKLISHGSIEKQEEWFRNHRSDKVSDLIRRLGRHDVLGYYFFEKLMLDHQGCSVLV